MMLGRDRSRRLLLGVTLSLLASSFAAPEALWTRQVVDRPRRVIEALVGPLARPLHEAGIRLRASAQAAPDLGDDPRVLADLLAREKAYRQKLEQQLAEARQVLTDSAELRGHLAASGATFIAARVTRWSPSLSNPTLSIDRGLRDGVAQGMVVAHKAYLVGRVTHATATHATVSLILAPGTPLAVTLVPPLAAPGELHPRWVVTIEATRDGGAFEAVANARDAPAVGYLAHLHRSDPNWTQEAWGLLLGQITSVAPDPDDPTARVRLIISPLLDPRRLNRVTVIAPGGPQPSGPSGSSTSPPASSP